MGTLLFQKINMNSRIHEVHRKELDLNIILNDIYEKFENGIMIELEEEVFIGEGSSEKKEKKKFRYETTDIVKDYPYIYGRIAKKYYKGNERILAGKTIESVVEVILSVPFCLNINLEYLCFLNRREFSPKSFINVFEQMLFKLSHFEFVIESIPNSNKLEESIKKFKKITSLKATIIPDNSINGDHFSDMLELMEDTNSNQAKFEFDNKNGINQQSKFIKSIYSSIQNAYGRMRLFGINENDEKLAVDTTKDVPHQEYVDDVTKDSQTLLEQKMREEIIKLFAKRRDGNK